MAIGDFIFVGDVLSVGLLYLLTIGAGDDALRNCAQAYKKRVLLACVFKKQIDQQLTHHV